MYKTIEQSGYGSFRKKRENVELDITRQVKFYTSPVDPEVWGPPRWFSFHITAANYPKTPQALVQERMYQFIMGIPDRLPCPTCSQHARAFIDKYRVPIKEVVKNRKGLFEFFVDFHNYVNKRYNKKIYTYDEAYAMYTGRTSVETIKYQ